jgi:hypothetical protein
MEVVEMKANSYEVTQQGLTVPPGKQKRSAIHPDVSSTVVQEVKIT